MTKIIEAGRMGAKVEFIYREDDDREGYLRVRFTSAALSGDFEWFVDHLGLHALMPFEQQLSVYPLDPADPPLLELYGGHSPGLRIEVAPVGGTGDLSLTLRMDEEDDQILQAKMPITYGTVQRLQAGLRALTEAGHGSFEVDLI
ncbi:hypothetical protein J2Y54_001782 [Sphingomonas sp. BE123]|uniref:hypothetical protein n=1 Tax=unclassified Sphingomonas TaxID=196159 RepID=UPI002855DC02|nr:hypothetical protein [Sphingomonas sp. BE123]MDR6852262.1 hypothetical protein [Sphingomonas sp. BE123]